MVGWILIGSNLMGELRIATPIVEDDLSRFSKIDSACSRSTRCAVGYGRKSLRRVENRMRVFAYLSFLSCLSFHSGVQGQAAPHDASPRCSAVKIFDSQPLSALSSSVQRKIRYALRPSILAIIGDPGMGMEVKWQEVKLEAIQISRPTNHDRLYVVHWGDRQFGVNDAIWIVEVKPDGARNLVAPPGAANPESSFSGYGMRVLSPRGTPYPEIVFAAKGFRKEGGPEAEPDCVQKIGEFYKSTPCPADCFHNLNAEMN
jgi:hypothetical protein